MEGGRRRSFGFMLTLPEGQCRIRLTAASCCPRRRERHEVQSRRRRLNWLLRCTPDRRSAARHMGGGVRARPRRPRAQPAVQGDSGPTSEISRPRAVVRRCRMRGPSVARTPVVRRTLICATGSPLKATPVGFVVVVLAAAAAATCCCGPRCRCRRRAAAEPPPSRRRVAAEPPPSRRRRAMLAPAHAPWLMHMHTLMLMLMHIHIPTCMLHSHATSCTCTCSCPCSCACTHTYTYLHATLTCRARAHSTLAC